jgi:hypothetical protein
MKRSLQALAVAVAAVALAATAADANVTVVRSIGASARAYPPGTSLPDSATLRLGAGDTVMVLGPGGTRTFRGPGAFRVNAPVQASSMAQAIGRRNVVSRVGAVRGGQAGAGIWSVDISRGGNFCMAESSPVLLWRRDARQASRVVVRAPDGAEAAVEFAAGRATGDWPAAVPVRPSEEYRIAGAAASDVPVRLIPVGAAPADPQETATLLIRHGCDAQLDRLLAQTPEG